VEAEVLGIFWVKKDEQLSLQTTAHHISRNTSCNTVIKTVLSGNGQSDYIGKIEIDKSAQQTRSFLEDHVLVTGKEIKNNSQPILQIEADDVSASHAATTGRISDEQVYYLMSRGLNKKESEELIVKGFLESLLSRIIDTDIRESVQVRLKS
jgi:Fe-S cluster assembly protein SufD